MAAPAVSMLDPQGVPKWVPAEDAELAQSQGWVVESQEEAERRRYARDAGPAEAAGAAGLGALSGATFGLLDLAGSGIGGEGFREMRQQQQEGFPILSPASQIAGAILPAIATGGTGLIARAAARTPAGALARAVGGRGLATAGAVEGAAIGAGDVVSEAAITDDYEDLAQKLVLSGGAGAAGGFLGGAALSGLGRMGSKMLEGIRAARTPTELTRRIGRASAIEDFNTSGLDRVTREAVAQAVDANPGITRATASRAYEESATRLRNIADELDKLNPNARAVAAESPVITNARSAAAISQKPASASEAQHGILQSRLEKILRDIPEGESSPALTTELTKSLEKFERRARTNKAVRLIDTLEGEFGSAENALKSIRNWGDDEWNQLTVRIKKANPKQRKPLVPGPPTRDQIIQHFEFGPSAELKLAGLPDPVRQGHFLALQLNRAAKAAKASGEKELSNYAIKSQRELLRDLSDDLFGRAGKDYRALWERVNGPIPDEQFAQAAASAAASRATPGVAAEAASVPGVVNVNGAVGRIAKTLSAESRNLGPSGLRAGFSINKDLELLRASGGGLRQAMETALEYEQKGLTGSELHAKVARELFDYLSGVANGSKKELFDAMANEASKARAATFVGQQPLKRASGASKTAAEKAVDFAKEHAYEAVGGALASTVLGPLGVPLGGLGGAMVRGVVRKGLSTLGETAARKGLSESIVTKAAKGFLRRVPRQGYESVSAAPTSKLLGVRPGETYTDALERIRRNVGLAQQQNPTERHSELAAHAPQTAAAVAATEQRALAFVQSKLGPSAQTNPLKPYEVPLGPEEQRQAAIYTVTALNPRTAIRDFENGELSFEQAETLQAVYPAIWADMQSEVLAALEDNDELGYQQRVSLGLLFGVEAEPSLSPESLMATQAIYAERTQQGPPNQGPAPGVGNAKAIQQRIASTSEQLETMFTEAV